MKGVWEYHSSLDFRTCCAKVVDTWQSSPVSCIRIDSVAYIISHGCFGFEGHQEVILKDSVKF